MNQIVHSQMVGSFVNNVTQTGSEMFFVEMFSGQTETIQSAFQPDSLNVFCGLAGKCAGCLQGFLLLSFSSESALWLVEPALSDLSEPNQFFDSMLTSALCEYGNVVAAQAAAELFGLGLQTEPSPCSLLRGNNLQISSLQNQTIRTKIHFRSPSVDEPLSFDLYLSLGLPTA